MMLLMMVDYVRLMPKAHELKIMPKYYSSVADGTKRFELRYNDRNFNIGDTLILREWDGDYTGRKLTCNVDYILNGHNGLDEGYVIMGITKQP